jgi:hypothetical protein
MRDRDVRLAIRCRLACEHAEDSDTRIVEEMGIWNGSVRVDVAVINGELAGYELKSARDTLDRLPAQAALYNQVFDKVFLVAAERHLAHAAAVLPDWWGIIVAHDDSGEKVRLENYRAAGNNPSIDALQLARLLWREEGLALLEGIGCSKGVRSASRERIAQRLADSLTITDLAVGVRRCLKDRAIWLGQPVSHQ